MKVHFAGISGSGMAQVARMFRDMGHDVEGCDLRFDPPAGPMLRESGVVLYQGYEARHLDSAPDLVVVGNALRADNPVALRAEHEGIARTSMSKALRDHCLSGRRSVVIAGTHGKTTTTGWVSWCLYKGGFEPGFFVGGQPLNFERGAVYGAKSPKLTGTTRPSRTPFVLEGDEYDDVYWSKKPKFLDYVGVHETDVLVLTSIEYDHVDLYPNEDAYVDAFRQLLAKATPGSSVIADASYPLVRKVCAEATHLNIVYYALFGEDTGDIVAEWQAAPAPEERGVQPFDVYGGGVLVGRFRTPLTGAHNVKNALATLAVGAHGFGIPWETMRAGIVSYEGVKRRQELLGSPNEVRVYDDFAHHPTAVRLTLNGLRARHPEGRLFAVFEPRSATACRALHQEEYTHAFGAADVVLLAPLGRTNVPEAEQLQVAKLASDLGTKATACEDVEAILGTLLHEAKPGDTIAVLSNGAFGGLHARLLRGLAE